MDYGWEKYRDEHQILETGYSPVLMIAIPAVVAAVAFISIITGAVFVESPLLFAFPLALAVVGIFVSSNVYRLPQRRFTHLFHRYFLRLSDNRITLATYSSTCPVCEGEPE